MLDMFRGVDFKLYAFNVGTEKRRGPDELDGRKWEEGGKHVDPAFYFLPLLLTTKAEAVEANLFCPPPCPLDHPLKLPTSALWLELKP
jgi:hypothetical protein